MPLPAARAVALVACLAAGCAHHRTNQYAYAPPLAPPVYPQPQTVPPAMTVAPGPVVAAPAVQAAPVVTGVPVSAAGEIPAHADGSCPPCAGGAGVTPVGYEAAVQTQPCPQ